MAAIAFALPILPGQGRIIRRLSEDVLGSEPLQRAYEQSRRNLGITKEMVWLQPTPIGEMVIVYWESEDPQQVLRKMATSQELFDRQFRQFIESCAPAIDLTKERPLANKVLFEWQAS